MVSSVLPGIDLIREAQEFLKGRIVRTPMVGSATFSEQFGCRIMFKMENMQKTGSFKIRGEPSSGYPRYPGRRQGKASSPRAQATMHRASPTRPGPAESGQR